MKPSALILVLAVTGAVSRAQEPGEKILFTRRAPVVGDRESRKMSGDTKMSVEIFVDGNSAQTMDMTQTEVKETERLVLAVADGRVTKQRIQFKSLTEAKTDGAGQTETKPSPLEGRTFIVTETEEGLDVRENDQEVDSETAKLVRKEVDRDGDGRIGKATDFGDLIPKEGMAIGETLKLPGDAVKAILGPPDDGMEFEEMTLKLDSVGRPFLGAPKCGAFELSTVMFDPSKGITVSLSGKIWVGIATLNGVSMRLTGPIELETSREQTQGNGETATIVTKMTGTMEMSAWYLLKPGDG